MTIASIQRLSVEFNGNNLFHDVSFDINEGDTVGLIGANGTGKTTLFKVIIGDLEPFEGGAYISKNCKIGYLEQHACMGSTRSVFDEALVSFSHLIDLEIEIERISRLLETDCPDRDMLIAEQSKLQDEFEDKGGLTYKSRTASALNGLGFKTEDFSLTCDKLSGGQRSKLSMCKLLLSGADLLLLDEPTNHLDIAGTEWLENFLTGYKGSILVISHDRYFLDKICNKTVEISNRTSHHCNGNYSVYQRLKSERLETERKHYENQLEEIKRIEGIIEQQRSFARERNFITAESKRKMLEKKKAELVEPEPDIAKMRIKFSAECETGNDVLNVTGLKKSFGDKYLFENCNLQVFKKDRAIIIGTNGCGKTTLLRILVGQMLSDEGKFKFGTNVKIGYFDQSLESLKGHKTVIDEIWDEHRLFTETEVRKYLSLFLFRGDDVFKSVDSLSGGEKAKLCLLKLMLSGSNVLLLDEPTNHLDIPSREILENALSNFEGTIIAVSHDRYFINKLATKIFCMKDNGVLKFDGSYDEYCQIALEDNKRKPDKPAGKVNQYKLKKERESEMNRLRGQIRRNENQIDELDSVISDLNRSLSSPEVSANYELIIEYTNEIEAATQKQNELLAEWEQLSSRIAELEET